MSPSEMLHLPAEEALFLGASLAHVALYNERMRLARIDQQNRMAMRSHERRTGGRSFP